jgi:hypothetical protein
VNWSSDRIQADLLQRINRDHFKSAITADMERHASDLDGGKRGVHVRVAAASALLNLAQPFGAESLSLSATVGGTLKEGGTINFAASDLKPNHPIKPLPTAQTLFNALGEGAGYESDLSLNFGSSGRMGLEDHLKSFSENVPEGIAPTATFDKPAGGGK